MRILKELACWCFVLSGLAWIAARLNRRKSLVLLYHGIDGGTLDPVMNYGGLHVRVDRFERQMRYIAARFRVVTLDQLLDGGSGSDGGKPLAVITFDDSYCNVYHYAYPVLKRLELPATVFVVTDFLEGDGAFWWDRAAAMVASTRCPVVQFPIRGTPRSFHLVTVRQKKTALRAVSNELLSLPPARREALLTKLAEDLGVEGRALETVRPIQTHQLREMAQDGISVGGHGRTHEAFGHLSRERLITDLTESKRTLESVVGRPVHWLAYPYGQFSRDAVEAARAADYRGAVTAIEEGLNDGIRDPFAIRRIAVDDRMSFVRFLVAVSGLRDTAAKAESCALALLKRMSHGGQAISRARRRIAVRLCLGLVWLFRHPPLKTLTLRDENTARYLSTKNYIAERVAEAPEYKALFSLFTSFRGKVVAEVGCSIGYLLDAFRRTEEFTAVGIDIDPTALTLGRETYGDRITFVQSAPASIPLAANSVDVLYSIDTAEHLNPPRENFLECYRILRPGGLFFVHFFPWWGPFGSHLEDTITFPWPHVFFSMDTLLAAAAERYDSPAYTPACYWFDPDTGERRPNPYQDHQRWQEYLNRLTVRGFRDLLKVLPFEVVHFQKFGFGGKRFHLARHLTALAQVPGFEEFFTKAIFCVLRKPLSATEIQSRAPLEVGPSTRASRQSWWGIGAGLRYTASRSSTDGDRHPSAANPRLSPQESSQDRS